MVTISMLLTSRIADNNICAGSNYSTQEKLLSIRATLLIIDVMRPLQEQHPLTIPLAENRFQ